MQLIQPEQLFWLGLILDLGKAIFSRVSVNLRIQSALWLCDVYMMYVYIFVCMYVFRRKIP